MYELNERDVRSMVAYRPRMALRLGGVAIFLAEALISSCLSHVTYVTNIAVREFVTKVHRIEYFSTMSDASSQETQAIGRGRARGRSRGGLGKYLRARGRGKGRGRPAEFTTRILLEGETPDEETEEEAAERLRKFSRRELGSNVDRYLEPEPELDSDGMYNFYLSLSNYGALVSAFEQVNQ